MIIRSLASHEGHLQPVEVEIELTAGLPQMHFLGLADQGIKESIYRIKCAIKQQGFEYPRTKQILVNLRPHHFKKSSRGLELAVAAGILIKTGQIDIFKQKSALLFYGELSLSGEVRQPEDLKKYSGVHSEDILTGAGEDFSSFSKYAVQNLKELKNPKHIPGQNIETQWFRPRLSENLKWSFENARFLEIMSVGGHHGLLAGASGLGKTTLAQTLGALAPEPTLRWQQQYQNYFESLSWRPQIEPHHTISAQGLLGGGSSLIPGEISRAHGGVLILDELLEFDPSALESLREPLEEGVIRLRKNNKREQYPAEFQLVATTNLCRCGDWIPGRARNCHYSMSQCMSTLRRVTGPFLDRFQILYFVKANTAESKNTKFTNSIEILERLKKVYEFQKTQFRIESNARLSESQLNVSDSLIKLHGLDELTPRRRISTLRVARTLADLEFQEEIRAYHIEESRQWAIHPFQTLKQGSS